MVELTQKLSDVLKAKKGSDTATINKDFLEAVNSNINTLTIETRGLFMESIGAEYAQVGPIPYLHESMKRRAQTIGIAYRIAIQYYIAAQLGRYDLIESLTDKLQYNSNKGYLDDIYKDEPHIIDAHRHALYNMGRLHTELYLGDNYETVVANLIASASVTFAWVETYYSTGFMPQDLSIIDITSDTHKMLTEEVEQLLDNATLLLQAIAILSDGGTHLYMGESIIDEGLGIDGTAQIIAGDTLIEVKTTQNQPTLPQVKKDANHIVALGVLEKGIGINHLNLYYSRYNELVELVV